MAAIYSLGVDVGSVSTKGVILDEAGSVTASAYISTEGDPLGAVQRLIQTLKAGAPPHITIGSVGTTGSARKLAGAMLEASVVKNEITAHAVGTLSGHPQVRTILEIGGQDAKIILLKDGIVTDYNMNTLCAAGTGAFLTAQAERLGLSIEEIGPMALSSDSPTRLSARCSVFAESDLIHKAQIGHSKRDLVAGLCAAVVSNYLNNVCKGKQITPPIIFQGGVSKNRGVAAAFEKELGTAVLVEEDGHLMGAVGAALLGANAQNQTAPFSFNLVEKQFETRALPCSDCPNHCEVVHFYCDGVALDHWGRRCEK